MNACYFTSETKFKRNKCDNSRQLNHLYFPNVFIQKSSNIDKFLQVLLLDFCEITIYGYNVDKKYYWAKKIKNNICVLMFTLSIDTNSITIIPNIGSDIYIKELYLNMLEGLEIYKNSSFFE